MSFKRQPLLNAEDETQLKEEFLPLWLSGMKGKQIAQELQFGVKGTKFAKVRPHYIYFFRQKFNDDEAEENKEYFGKFKLRRKAPFAKGTSRYKNQPKDLGLMPVEVFVETLNAKCSSYSLTSKRIRTYLIIHYFSPLRSSEILERLLKDFEITPTKITIHLLRKKKKKNKRIKDESINIRRSFPLVNEIVDYFEAWKSESKKNGLNQRPFNFSPCTAWNYTRQIFEGYYPHYFRFNYISEEADQPNTSMLKLKSKTKLTPQVLNNYMIDIEETEESVDDAREERYRKKGMI